jgi:ethanolamine utilization protein EutN
MFLAKVKKSVVGTVKHKAYEGKTLFIVQPVQPDGQEKGSQWIAMDYVGAGIGDTVICGGAPGVAQDVFGLKRAPIRTLIMAIIDKIECNE